MLKAWLSPVSWVETWESDWTMRTDFVQVVIVDGFTVCRAVAGRGGNLLSGLS